MPATRPYRIEFNGQTRMVEASHVSQAIAHLARQLVTDARPATAKEVAHHYRDGGSVEVAGREESAKPSGTDPLPPSEENGGQQQEWPVEKAAGNAALLQFSADGENWHDVHEDGDIWERSSTDGETWSEAVYFGPQPTV